MRGTQDGQASMLAVVFDRGTVFQATIRSDGSRGWRIKSLRNCLEVFNRMYSQVGRPSIAPERILKSLLLIALYSVRSERQFSEQLGYNLSVSLVFGHGA